MAANVELNNSKVAELLESLLGRDTTATEGKAPNPGNAYCGIACYRRAEGELSAVAVSDVAFAAHAGACLALVPVGSANEMIEAAELSEGVQENAGEVFNVLGVGLTAPEGPPIRLAEMTFGSEAPAPEITKVIESASVSIDLEVTIDGYGKGLLSLYVA